jgi:hypothetical protein
LVADDTLNIVQVVGYASRAAAASRTGSLVPFVIQQNNILLAPVLYAASIYMTLGRIIRSVKGEKYAMISPRWLTALFLGGDILALAVQGSAAGLMVVAEYAKMAQGIAIAGLVIQVITFGLFWITSWMFHLKMRRNAEATCLISDEVKWEQSMRMLYGVSALIMLRSVFRLIEFTVGVDGYLLSHEWPLYIFDAVPMVCVMCIFWHWFPSSATQPQKTMFVPL